MTYKEVIVKVAKETNLPEEIVDKAYKAYWYSIRSVIQSLPLKDIETEDSFNKEYTSFNIPSLGKLGCTFDRMLSIKQGYRKRHDKD